MKKKQPVESDSESENSSDSSNDSSSDSEHDRNSRSPSPEPKRRKHSSKSKKLDIKKDKKKSKRKAPRLSKLSHPLVRAIEEEMYEKATKDIKKKTKKSKRSKSKKPVDPKQKQMKSLTSRMMVAKAKELQTKTGGEWGDMMKESGPWWTRTGKALYQAGIIDLIPNPSTDPKEVKAKPYLILYKDNNTVQPNPTQTASSPSVETASTSAVESNPGCVIQPKQVAEKNEEIMDFIEEEGHLPVEMQS